jgi:hypothetical protein
MNDNDERGGGFSRLWKWATTRPQVYVVYVVALVLVWAISFYAGTLNPRRSGGGLGPPPVSTPQR